MSWRERAACINEDPETFFPKTSGRTGGLRAAQPALRVCARCTVKAECLQFALDSGEHRGVWGGMTEVQRRKLTRPLRLVRSA